MKLRYELDISMYETAFLEKAMQSRMRAMASKTTADYLFLMDHVPGESYEMIGQLSNSYSEFFRSPLTFTYLEQIILPALIGEKLKNKENGIRIWSAACASGQEAYSVAILFDEIVQSLNAPVDLQIFATDNNEGQLDNAKRGIYPLATVNKVSLKRINTYFTQQDGYFTIDQELKKYIDFSIFDLIAEHGNCPPASVYGNFDLVFCSNLLFYYKPSYRQRILDKVGNCLASGGFLVTGESEREMVKGINFREVFPNSGIFQKR